MSSSKHHATKLTYLRVVKNGLNDDVKSHSYFNTITHTLTKLMLRNICISILTVEINIYISHFH